jgi:hypothetical protein
MPLTIACTKCGKQYQVAEHAVGKQVRCQQCATVFTVAAPAPVAALDPLGDLSLASLPPADPLRFPALGGGTLNGALPAASANAQSTAAWHQHGVENPSGGPPDMAMRLVSGGLAAIGLFLLAANFILDQTRGEIYLAPLLLAPLALILGIAGVINPNVVRAAGKYGGHLSWHYKAIGAVLVVLSLLASGLLLLGYYAAGCFRV